MVTDLIKNYLLQEKRLLKQIETNKRKWLATKGNEHFLLGRKIESLYDMLHDCRWSIDYMCKNHTYNTKEIAAYKEELEERKID